MKKTLPVVLILLLTVSVYYVYSYLTAGSRNTETIVEVSSFVDKVTIETNTPGNSVNIPKVVLSKPGYVMIHESNNEKTGVIVMTSSYLPAGESINVVVRTGKATRSGEKYFAMLHEDDGNRKYDSPGTDYPVYNNGSIVQEEFSIE